MESSRGLSSRSAPSCEQAYQAICSRANYFLNLLVCRESNSFRDCMPQHARRCEVGQNYNKQRTLGNNFYHRQALFRIQKFHESVDRAVSKKANLYTNVISPLCHDPVKKKKLTVLRV
jgi:hypothetical protein